MSRPIEQGRAELALASAHGRAALALAAAQDDPASLAAATRLRAEFDPELAVAALHQEQLRRRARAKFGDLAAQMLFTDAGLEQATRPAVARWRAERLAALGVRTVVDLGCGIGADAMACAAAGLDVVAVEVDPVTAAIARYNLVLLTPDPQVVEADATAVVDQVVPAGAAVMLDPARRTHRGRSWRLEDLSPPWSFVTDLVDSGAQAVVKLGPGVDRSALPAVPTSHVSHRGDAVETTLWAGWAQLPPVEAVLVADDQMHTLTGTPSAAPLGPVHGYLHEPDPAISRAQLVTELGPGIVQLDQHAGYFSSEQPLTRPWATSFAVLEVLDAKPKALKAWVRAHDIGTLEIKKRGRGGFLDVDPAALRRQLNPRGRRPATLVLAAVQGRVRALVVERVEPSP